MLRAGKHRYYKVSSERLFCIPDIHGELELLTNLLDEINYDAQNDTLIFLGDLINRGPYSFETLRAVTEIKNAIRVLGNHEDSLIKAFNRSHRGQKGIIDTGKNENWQNEVCPLELGKVLDQLCATSTYTATVELASGHLFGLCHGDAVMKSWKPEKLATLGKEKIAKLVYSRAKFKNEDANVSVVEGVDWTIHGHTITPEIRLFENSIYLDTGAGSVRGCRKLSTLELNTFASTKCLKKSSFVVHK